MIYIIGWPVDVNSLRRLFDDISEAPSLYDLRLKIGRTNDLWTRIRQYWQFGIYIYSVMPGYVHCERAIHAHFGGSVNLCEQYGVERRYEILDLARSDLDIYRGFVRDCAGDVWSLCLKEIEEDLANGPPPSLEWGFINYPFSRIVDGLIISKGRIHFEV